MRLKYALLGLASGGVLIIAGFGYWTISPFFRVVMVEDEIPETSNMTAESVPVTGTLGHPASGTARIVTNADGSQQVLYENFSTLNGPDLFVYLAKDLSAKEFISLGRIRGTEGTIAYEVPTGVNLEEYPYVLTWCKAFSVLFNHANLSPLFAAMHEEPTMCAQVITPARNAETGEIHEFPTPCDVPSGWDIIQSEGLDLI